MPIDRDQLEKLLAERPATQRSAMQAVRDGYDDITLMRERGLSWAEISEVLARLGIVARDNNPIAPVTLRSAYFLVGNESRDDSLSPSDSSRRPVIEAILAEGRTRKVGDEVAARPSASKEAASKEAASEEAVPPAPSRGVAEAEGRDPPEPGPPSEPEAPPETGTSPEAEAPPETESLSEPAPYSEPETPRESETPTVVGIDRAAEGCETPNEVVAVVPNNVDLPETGGPGEGVEPVADPPPAAPLRPAEGEPSARVVVRTIAPAPKAEPETNSLEAHPLEADSHESNSTASTNARGHRMLGTIFVLNDRGGVGKTLLSHHLMATAMLEGLELKVVEYEVNERLARLFGPEVVEHRRITQDFMNLMGSGDGFYEFWDQIGPELQRGGRLFDFGGNISQWFFNWAEVSGFDYYVGDGERLTFMVPVTVDLASLSTGMATLDRIAAIAPKANRVLVENGVSGPFNQLEDSQYGRRKAELVEREGVDVISMPPCAAPAWARLTGHRIDQVARMTREDLVKLGMTPPVASRSLIIIHDWLRGMREALAPYVADAFRVTPTPASGRTGR